MKTKDSKIIIQGENAGDTFDTFQQQIQETPMTNPKEVLICANCLMFQAVLHNYRFETCIHFRN